MAKTTPPEYATLRSVEGRPLHVRVERPAGARGPLPFVVVMHGFKGFMHWGFFPELSRRIAAAGLVAVSLNGSRNGVSAGPEDPSPAWDVIDDGDAFEQNTHSLEVADLGVVREYARALAGVDGAREGLLGHSRGGAIAILSAAARPPRALVTWASIEDVDRVDEATKALWRATGVLEVPNARTGQVHRLGLALLEDHERNRAEQDVRAAARRVPSPALVVHGTADGAVDFAAARHLSTDLPAAELLAIDGANHVFGATHPMSSDVHPHLATALEATLRHFTRHLLG